MSARRRLRHPRRGCVDVVTRRVAEDEARPRPAAHVKVGFDPTAPDLHLGHTVLIRKMKHFQDLGHRVVFVIGDFTGHDRRPHRAARRRVRRSRREEIERNAETYKQQVFKILDRAKTEIRFNREWLGPLGSDGFVRLAATYNVARMLERRDFKQRYESGQPISLHEFLYPLAQAYDSVALEGRRRARRHRPALQPERRPRHHAGLRPRAADGADDAAARGHGRRREDVEEPRQLHRRHRAARGRCSPSS